VILIALQHEARERALRVREDAIRAREAALEERERQVAAREARLGVAVKPALPKIVISGMLSVHGT
jgi:hypothetical protein